MLSVAVNECKRLIIIRMMMIMMTITEDGDDINDKNYKHNDAQSRDIRALCYYNNCFQFFR